MNIENRINEEKERLNAIFNDLEENERRVAQGLIDQACFLLITLEELQKSINQNGFVGEYQNGNNQFGTKTSAELQAYNSTLRSYSSVVGKLLKIVPAKPRKIETPQEKWARYREEQEKERLAFVERIKREQEERARKAGENLTGEVSEDENI